MWEARKEQMHTDGIQAEVLFYQTKPIQLESLPSK